MSTLGRDFGAEYGNREAWVMAHLEHWLVSQCREPVESARGAILEALASDPAMVEWASWPMVLAKGRWLQKGRV